MRISNGWRPGPPSGAGSSHPDDAVGRRARPILAGQRARRGLSPSGACHLQAGTARRALNRNLAHLHRCLADPRLPDHERRVLEQSMAALEVSLRDHRALRTRMAAMILG